jgi:hypothetical protein
MTEEVKEVLILIETKEHYHKEKYKQFVNETSHIMNGHSIAANTCREIIKLIEEYYE